MTRRVWLMMPLLLAAGLATPLADPVAAQVELTVAPALTRGPADAPVTIVEFSDFE